MLDKYKRREIVDLLKACEWYGWELAYKTDAELIDLLIMELRRMLGWEDGDNETT